MAKIKSIKLVTFDSKYQEEGTIMIEINSPIHDIANQNIRCNINYYHLEDMKLIFSDSWNLPSEKRNILIQASINEIDSIDSLLAQFLLEKVQTEIIKMGTTIYNLFPEEWEIY